MALFWSKKPKAEKNYENETRKAKIAGTKLVKKSKSVEKKSDTKSTKASETMVPVGRFTDDTSSLIKPHITEKSGILSQGGVYTFEISSQANKNSVARAVTMLYKVHPTKVAIVNLPGKSVFVKGRRGSVSGKRKAIVTVKKGEKIDFV